VVLPVQFRPETHEEKQNRQTSNFSSISQRMNAHRGNMLCILRFTSQKLRISSSIQKLHFVLHWTKSIGKSNIGNNFCFWYYIFQLG